MISRRSAQAIAQAYHRRFTHTTTKHLGYGRTYSDTKVYSTSLYDFLFVHDYTPWLCNAAAKLSGSRSVLEWIMKLHTGETQAAATIEWSWEERRKLGQQLLAELAEDILNAWHAETESFTKQLYEAAIAPLERSLELDGYRYSVPRLIPPESDVLDSREESGVLVELYRSLRLGNAETALHHLRLSEEHYLASRWDDSISNSRKFLECVLQETAAAHSERVCGVVLSSDTFSRPAAVRDYLADAKLLESKEKDALSKVYGLLSHTGAHPYMAANDQARLLRHLSLTLAQFVLLRFRGSIGMEVTRGKDGGTDA